MITASKTYYKIETLNISVWNRIICLELSNKWVVITMICGRYHLKFDAEKLAATKLSFAKKFYSFDKSSI